MNTELLKLIKQAALTAVKEYGLCDVEYGKVESVSPLNIRTEQKVLLDEDFLELTKNVTDHEIKISINDGPEQKAVVKNALKTGDRVLLLKAERAQMYIVLDRVEGE